MPTTDRPVRALWCPQCGGALADGGHEGCVRSAELEPPRWCALCRRRMVVQVLPRGWWASCVEHGRQQGPQPD